MQYRPFEEGIEVNGRTVWAIVDGFTLFKTSPSRILLAEGIGAAGPKGIVHVDPDHWYSQAAWLRAFERIGEGMGAGTLFKIGARIPENAEFPPWVKDIHSAIKSIDIAYHMNHRKNGKVMFDPSTGKLTEGIGHYGYAAIEGRREIVSVCGNPYPCAFDHGILTAMAQRFEAKALVTHDPDGVCRAHGGDRCTYRVTW